MRTVLLSVGVCTTLSGTAAGSTSSGIVAIPVHSVGGTPPKLPSGASGKVVVVATGPIQSDKTLPVAIRNNTSQAVNNVKVTATAYVGSRLVATGADQGVKPSVIAPRGLALAYIYFNGATPAAGTTYKFSVASERASQSRFFNHADLVIKTANYTGGKLIGTAHNSTKAKISGPLGVYATCFSGNHIVAMENGYSDADDAPAGADAPFTLDFSAFGTTSPPHCDRVLVAMSGYSF